MLASRPSLSLLSLAAASLQPSSPSEATPASASASPPSADLASAPADCRSIFAAVIAVRAMPSPSRGATLDARVTGERIVMTAESPRAAAMPVSMLTPDSAPRSTRLLPPPRLIRRVGEP